MCGIFASLYSEYSVEELTPSIQAIQHRGPDHTEIAHVTQDIILGFHRLAINDLSPNGNQPMSHPQHPEIKLVCNGEIYNHKLLSTQFGFPVKSGSDCEVILHLYKRFGILETCKMLDGYFAFVLVDGEKVYAARDVIGIRSLYMGSRGKSIYLASELKAIHDLCDSVSQFPPGCYWDGENFTVYHHLYSETLITLPEEQAIRFLRKSLENAVEKRVETTERPIGCLLSGGLDSSIICALVNARSLKNTGKPVHTFSIGFEGSTDCHYARMVAQHLGTVHHEVIVTPQDMIEAIPEVIRMIETYDTTTVRASTPMYLLCKYIAQHTDIRVVFSGEGSDEVSGSYLYFHQAPNEKEFHEETLRLVRDLHYFDVLRCDKSTACNGLEVRVPFLDRNFLQFYLHLNPVMKMPARYSIEKYLLRKAFEDLLPHEVTWRVKEAFSDGVSSREDSWFSIIQRHVSTLNLKDSSRDSYLPPVLKETRWYRSIYDTVYPGRERLLPYYWLPRWVGDVADPSARVLSVYR
jgi:asparagine synthase (glutamine-hydrolysing)